MSTSSRSAASSSASSAAARAGVVRDLPAVAGSNELHVLVVDGGADGDAGYVSVDVLDLDVESAVDSILLAFAIPGELEHPLLRRDAELDAGATLDEILVQRAFHPHRIAVEPALEVVADRCHHRVLVALRS
jgi:hypothetical protein